MFSQACGHMIKPVHTELDIKVFIRNKSINACEFYSVIIPTHYRVLLARAQKREEHDA